MKKIVLLAAAFFAFVAAEAKTSESAELNLRIGTYNVWSHSAREGQIKKGTTTESRNWENSKKAVAKQIVDINCDILAMQEVTSVCRDDLAKLVKKQGGKKYKLWWVNTYPEGMRIIGNAVFYDKKKFSLSQENIYYFSPTPEVASKGWDEKRYYRASLVTVVTHKKSGKKFFLLATHGPLKKVANGHAGRLLVEFDKKYNTENLPSIALGDMNARPGQAFHQNMCAYFEDCYLATENKIGTIGTFNGSKGSEAMLKLPHRRIDQIYVHSTEKGKFEVKKYEVVLDKHVIDGEKHYPSDHNPVVVDLTIK